MNGHMLTQHTEDGDWNCKDCDFQTNSKINLQKHIKEKHTQPTMLTCKHCLVNFKTKVSLNIHIRENYKLYKLCDKLMNNECEDALDNEGKLKDHMHRTHASPW